MSTVMGQYTKGKHLNAIQTRVEKQMLRAGNNKQDVYGHSAF